MLYIVFAQNQATKEFRNPIWQRRKNEISLMFSVNLLANNVQKENKIAVAAAILHFT